MAEFWLMKVVRNDSLPDYASKFRFERGRPATIAELLDIQQRIASHGKLVEVTRRFTNIDRTMPEHVQGPPRLTAARTLAPFAPTGRSSRSPSLDNASMRLRRLDALYREPALRQVRRPQVLPVRLGGTWKSDSSVRPAHLRSSACG